MDAPKELRRLVIIDKLLSKGADVNVKYGISGNDTLMLSIINNDIPIINKLLSTNININARNLKGETTLILAINGNIDKKVEIISKLLEHKDIKINEKDNKGRTATTHAVTNNNYEIIKLLLNRNDIDINTVV